jgi:hypothetical protein
MYNTQESKYRSEVIERFINIEWLINAIITQHYFKRIVASFLFDVLYDEYFNFGLKRRILEKIIPNIDKSRIHDLNRLNTIRNYFAHCNQEIFFGSGIPHSEEKGFIPNPRKLTEEVDFETLYNEFLEIEKSVANYLMSILKSLGAKITKGED